MMHILEKKIELLTSECPQLTGFFSDYGISFNDLQATLSDSLDHLSEEIYEDIGIDREKLLENLDGFLQRIHLSATTDAPTVTDITIIGGHDKNGYPEQVELTLLRGSVTSIVGPTGSGKSRLLADIEWMAQNDTPTGRIIRVNGQKPDPELRFSLEYKLVAQLSQHFTLWQGFYYIFFFIIGLKGLSAI